jgi:hypothetical protein
MEASPGYFRPGRESYPGEWLAERLEPWVEASYEWLIESFGKLAYSAVLHLDEVTPHIHALILPLNETGQLSYMGLFRRGHKFINIYETYFAKIAPLGFKYPERSFRDNCSRRLAYYNYVNLATTLKGGWPLKDLKPPPPLSWAERLSPARLVKAARKVADCFLSQILMALKAETHELLQKVASNLAKFERLCGWLKVENGRQEQLRSLKYGFYDSFLGYWLKKRLGIKPTLKDPPETLAVKGEALNGHPKPPLKPPGKRRIKRASSLFPPKGGEDYPVADHLTIHWDENGWVDPQRQAQGRSGASFLGYVLGYPPEKLALVAKIIWANNTTKIKWRNPLTSLAKCLAKEGLGTVRSQLAQSLAKHLERKDESRVKVFIDEDKVREVFKAAAAEIPLYVLGPPGFAPPLETKTAPSPRSPTAKPDHKPKDPPKPPNPEGSGPIST